ncbi:MAG: oligosaccharide flippase family protein [Alistipes sp.]|nr:oligosaccharide flippase family protein [Alistipes sp.]
MLEKLAKQTAVYGISTILGRFLSYLLTPFYTRIFGVEAYGIITDVYALIPFALVLLTMGMESGYFRFAAKAEAEVQAAAADNPAIDIAAAVKAAKRRLFATTWGITSLAAILFFIVITIFRLPVSDIMGEAYAAHPEYVVIVAAIVMFDVMGCIPFSRLREQGRAAMFVTLKMLNIVMQVGLAVAFWAIGLFDSDFGVGWAFVANLIASIVTWALVIMTADRTLPRIDSVLLAAIFAYSLPLLISGIAGTANEFIDRQLIKYLVPTAAMAQLGIYGAITKIAVVMTLFTQMYRLAAEPFFLSNFKKEEFVEMNAAALKYYIIASMLIFLGISLFKELFALIVGSDFREGIFILPVILGANVLSGVWLNLSFWYKREERTELAVWVTFTGLIFTVLAGVLLIPRWGYYGAACGRFISEAAMVVVSFILNRRLFPTPYDLRRIAFYVVSGLAVFVIGEYVVPRFADGGVKYAIDALLFAGYTAAAVKIEKIDLRAMAMSIIKRKRK